MTNIYDVTLSEKEKKELLQHVKAIKDYCTDLVKDFDTEIRLVSKWSYHDSIWGTQKRSIEIYKGTKDTTISGECGGLHINFDKISDYELTEYCLSLIDFWKDIKQELLVQFEQAKKTRALTKGFEL